MFGFTEAQLYDDAKDVVDKNWGIKPRDFFEQFGWVFSCSGGYIEPNGEGCSE